MEKEGIETIKETLIGAARLVNTTDASLEDGRISPIEWGKIGISGFAFARGIAKFKQLKAEWKDLSEGERKEIVETFEKEFDLRNDEAEKMIEEAFSAIMQLTSLIFVKAA